MRRVLLLLAASTVTLGAQTPSTFDTVTQHIDGRRDRYATVARQIWEFAEVGFQETKSSALLQGVLRAAGFRVEAGVADMPTAFVASWGSGRPIIAFIGEFDALPGLSQQAKAERSPVAAGGPGHGCGHHLLGTGSMAAAIAVKEWLQATGGAGTVRYYGTPAEEGGSGKVYIVRAGLFKDVDAALAWHPADHTGVSAGTTLANITAKFRFHGVSAHAAAAPDRGRSALDAVEAMNYMVNLMREHVPQETRLHYVITQGGRAPNVVPDFAEVYHYARHPDMPVLAGIWDRVVKAAEGAALGTGTRMEYEIIGAVHNVLSNEYLSRRLHEHLDRVGGVQYDAADRSFAEALHATLDSPRRALGSERLVEPPVAGEVSSASTDLGDVSWNVPTAELSAATWVPGTPAHSWQATACGGTTIGTKGMLVAAKALARLGVDLLSNPDVVRGARESFERQRGKYVYEPMLGDRKPALDYRR
ncbi:MAG: amidohydrolase [Acidobacteria bacterium]|nr:amidohydrolase [Acidobacteriota bacterium]